MTAEQRAEQIYSQIFLGKISILTKMDSIPTEITDYPTAETAKMLAALCIDEIIEVLEEAKQLGGDTYNDAINTTVDYYFSVKTHLLNT